MEKLLKAIVFILWGIFLAMTCIYFHFEISTIESDIGKAFVGFICLTSALAQSFLVDFIDKEIGNTFKKRRKNNGTLSSKR